MQSDASTIAAVATPPGQGGIGIVRLSGVLAHPIAESITGGVLPPRRATLRQFMHKGELLDQGIALYFPAPGSFTGEDVVELQGHGGPMVLYRLLKAALAQGARMARPGEFTQRAFANGKLDLAQAEAVADLIASASAQAARGAMRSLSGAFSAKVTGLEKMIVRLRVYVEASIDFPEEEVEFLASGQLAERLDVLLASVRGLLKKGRQGVLMSQGVDIALVGAPNVGKSSLLNRLTGEDTAIVTDLPGTTRDLLKVDLVLDGLPIRLVDTAGLRATEDPAEAEGVRRARRQAAQADLVLAVSDSTERSTATPEHTAATPHCEGPRALLVDNKIDLSGLPPGVDTAGHADRVRISCLTGAGIADLKKAIKARIGFSGEQTAFSARRRHLVALQQTAQGLAAAREQLEMGAPGELIAEELRQAHLSLGQITGETAPDDLLGEIFSTFCIGK